MNNYLLLLKERKTIIIPGLGALTITNDATNDLLFMPFLSYDDGSLSMYISEKEGITENEAKNRIAHFVREVLKELDKGESYDMYQFGQFSKVNNEIVFNQWEGKRGVVTPNEQDEKTVVTSPKSIEKSNKSTNYIVDKKTTEATESYEISNPSGTQVHLTKKQVIQVVSEVSTNQSSNTSKLVQDKKGVHWMVQFLTILAVLLLSAGTYVAINLKTLQRDIPFFAQIFGKDSIVGIKSLKEDAILEKYPANVEKIPASFAIPKEKKTTKEKSTSPSKLSINIRPTLNKKVTLPAPPIKTSVSQQKTKSIKNQVKKATPTIRSNSQTFPQFNGHAFQLIAGSFSSEQHALKQAKQLIKKGITTCFISSFDGKYRISIGSSETKENAMNQLLTLRKIVADTWIFEMK